ncbi:rapid alkalinization factor-like [Typha latifolia]|uniref:rapid alkalinization factor-like n=1 Tax=Typha latifolia TaxID=4733 RepID=UPI003C2C17B6
MPKPPTSITLTRMVASMAFLLLLFSCGQCSAGEMLVNMGCGGKVGDCLLLEEGLEMGSEANRRMVLWATEKRYISYESLKGEVVPCTKPGVPYYNCRALPRANPYSRGCEIITACARDANP